MTKSNKLPFSGIPTQPYVHYEANHGRGWVPVADRASAQAAEDYRVFVCKGRNVHVFTVEAGVKRRMGYQMNGPGAAVHANRSAVSDAS